MDFKTTLAFLSELKEHNTKEWFDAHRKEYEAVKKDMNLLVSNLISGIVKWDHGLIGIEPKDCIFRINRDVRFSKDKSPYKTNVGAVMAKGGRKSSYAGYYIHIEPAGAFLAGGCYQPQPDQLKAIRQEIDYDLPAFEKILNHKDFKNYFNKLEGEKLSKPPKGYEADHSAAEYLKHKSFLMVHKLSDKDLMKADIENEIVKIFKAMKPLGDFLNRSLE
jgi:uncharacterized protein (TIGR02453 family)